MNLNTLTIGPAVKGTIRIASQFDEATGTLKTLGEMGVYSRVHEKPEGDKQPQFKPHACEEALRKLAPNESGKLVEIPIKMFFNKAENGLKIGYQAFDALGRPVCSGDGKNAMRRTTAGDGTQTLEKVACPGSETCQFGNAENSRCHRQMKLTVHIDGQEDPLSAFEVRSTSINSYRNLWAQLRMVEKACGGLRHVPLKLQVDQMSNQLSGYEPFDVFKLALGARDLADARAQAEKVRTAESNGGNVLDTDEIFFSEQIGEDGGSQSFDVDLDLYDDALFMQPARRRHPSVAQTVGAAAKVQDMMSAAIGLNKKPGENE